MKISLNWINDFVDLEDVDYKELIKKFTLATAEVEDVYEVGKDIIKRYVNNRKGEKLSE